MCGAPVRNNGSMLVVLGGVWVGCVLLGWVPIGSGICLGIGEFQVHLHRVWGEHAVGSCVIRMSLGWNLVIVYYHLNFFVGFEYWCVCLCIEGCTLESFGCVSDNIWQFRAFRLCLGVCVKCLWGLAQQKQQKPL